MDRRSLIALLTVTMTAPQTALARNKGAHRQKNEGTQGQNNGPAAAHAEASVDAMYAERTLAIGAVALETSRLAQSTAKDDWVKRFANFEVAEQTTVADVLGSLGMKVERGEQAADVVDQLKKSSNFDADYLAAQLDGHQQLLKVQEEYVQVGKDPAHVGLAKLAKNQVKEHIDLIQTIQKTLKA